MRNIIYAIFILITFCTLDVHSDTIYLKENKIIYGQLIKVTYKYIIVEVVSNTTGKVNNISLQKNEVIRIDDESGRTIYSDGIVRYPIRSHYNNRDGKIKYLPVDRIFLKKGQIFLGEILSNRDSKILIKNYDPNKTFIRIKIDSTELDHIEKNAGYVAMHDPFLRSPLLKRVSQYPDINIGFGFGYVQTKYDEIEDRIQYFYDTNDSLKSIGLNADKIKSTFIGLQIHFGIRFTDYLAIGFHGFQSLGDDDHLINFVSGQIKYTYNLDRLHPWISVGYAFQSSKITQDVDQIISEYGYNRFTLRKIEWKASDNGPLIGIGLEVGEETGIGVQVSAEYMPFSKKITKITDDRYDFPFESSFNKKVDLSLIVVSFGINYKY
jgi:hypothetical protein